MMICGILIIICFVLLGLVVVMLVTLFSDSSTDTRFQTRLQKYSTIKDQ